MITNIGKRQVLRHLPATRERLLQLCHDESPRHANKLDHTITALMRKGIVKNSTEFVKVKGTDGQEVEKPVKTIVLNDERETQAA